MWLDYFCFSCARRAGTVLAVSLETAVKRCAPWKRPTPRLSHTPPPAAGHACASLPHAHLRRTMPRVTRGASLRTGPVNPERTRPQGDGFEVLPRRAREGGFRASCCGRPACKQKYLHLRASGEVSTDQAVPARHTEPASAVRTPGGRWTAAGPLASPVGAAATWTRPETLSGE